MFDVRLAHSNTSAVCEARRRVTIVQFVKLKKR